MDWSSSSGRKLARGIEHARTLRRETETFENANAYVIRTEREERSREEVIYRCFATEREAPPDHWPLLAGETLHNLRSALESSVWAASNGRGRPQFPIFTDPCEFQVMGRPMIARTPKAIRALIERRQPYNAMPNGPEWDALAILRTLSNLDKHRTLTTIAAAVDLPFISHDGGPVEVQFLEVWEDRPLDKDTHVMTYAVRHPQANQVQVYPDLRYQVRIEGRGMASTFVYLARRVFECVWEVENGIAIPDMTPAGFYPI